MAELGPVQIGAREIYDKLLELDKKVDKIATRYDEVWKKLHDHEARVRDLEKGRWPLPSLAVVVAGASLLMSVWRFLI